jgi:5-methylcytosine-specific restriction endonuclease McrA
MLMRTQARKDALALGLKRYFTGVACCRGHVAERRTSTGQCLLCEPKKTPRRRGDRTRTLQNARIRAREYHRDNREARRAYYENWKAENPGKARENWRNNKARRKGAAGSHRASDIDEIMTMQRHRCAYCRADLRKVKSQIDHIEPIRRGGSNYRSNLQMLCVACNLSKHARHPIEFAQSIGLLL